jgi:hypothetical protein
MHGGTREADFNFEKGGWPVVELYVRRTAETGKRESLTGVASIVQRVNASE